jgi:tripartite-type tricarboxylate transporter receptor subunit TctC
MKLLPVLVIGLLGLMCGAKSVEAQFYKGKTLRIVVGAAPGGSFDLHSRLLARHIAKHITGTPTVFVDNMPGAGQLIAANHVYNLAKPDGLTIGSFTGGLFLQEVLGINPGIEFESRKYIPLGVTFQATDVLVLRREADIRSLEELMRATRPVKIGVSSPGSNLYDNPAIIQEGLGLPIQLVSGYKGFADIRLALESGEVEGVNVSWETIKQFWGETLLKNRDVIPIVQTALNERLQDLPNVPTGIESAKTEKSRQLIKHGIVDVARILGVYALRPDTPKDRVETLRKAFEGAVKDPDFLADAERAKIEIKTLRGSEVEGIVVGLGKMDPSVKAKLKEILAPKKR